MSSFLSIWENMQKSRRDKKDVKSIIHIGYNISENLWNDIIKLLQNSESISKLLDVPEHKVATWQEKIENAIEDEKSTDSLITSKNNKIVKEDNQSAIVQDKIQKIIQNPNKNQGLIMFFEEQLLKITNDHMLKLSGQKQAKTIRDVSAEQRNIILQSIIQAGLNVFFSGFDSEDKQNKSNTENITQKQNILPKDTF